MNWHALYVKSRTEKKVGLLLTEKKFNAYVPLIKTMRIWSDRKKMVEMPLLNGYVFVQSEDNQREIILQTQGVVNFVRSEGKIAVIRDIEIERLKQLIGLGYHLEANALERKYKEGDKIKISSGPLKGIEGFVTGTQGDKVIEVLLESIRQCIKVKLPPQLLVSV